MSPADAVQTPTEVSAVTQDYLKAVWAASEWGGSGASITGLARRMRVAPSTASENVGRLVEAGLLEHEPYRAVTLSRLGYRLAMGMVRRHRLLETYLVERLGLSWDEVHAEAEALDRPVRDPHGDPIPTPEGRVIQPALYSVDMMPVGQTGVVGRIKDCPRTLRRLARAGIGLGTSVTVTDRGTMSAVVLGEKRRKATVVRAARPAGQSADEPGDVVLPMGHMWVLA